MLRRWATCFLLISAALVVRAEVYTLWPFQHGSGGRPGLADQILNAQEIMSEPVVVNGSALHLKVALISDTLERCVLQLRSAYPRARFDRNSDSVRVTIPDGTKYVRLLLLQLGRELPVIQFSMILPGGLPGSFEWPTGLPITADGKPVECIYYPNRRIWYGRFTTGSRPAAAAAEIAEKMAASGWSMPGAGELSRAPSGLMMVRKSPSGLLMVNFSGGGQGAVMLQESK